MENSSKSFVLRVHDVLMTDTGWCDAATRPFASLGSFCASLSSGRHAENVEDGADHCVLREFAVNENDATARRETGESSRDLLKAIFLPSHLDLTV